MLTLYYAPQTRASRIVWMLEELGQPFELKLVDIRAGAQHQAEYRRINPMGKVPALADGDTLVWESGAICTYLADRYPAASLAPGINDARRGDYLKWMFFASSDIEPAFAVKGATLALPSFSLGWGDEQRVLDAMVTCLTPSPFVLGERFSAADIIMGSIVQYGTMVKMMPEKPEFTRYMQALAARPAFQRAMAREAAMAG